MPFVIPLVGKILAGLASSETSASPAAAQKTDTDNASTPNVANFTQTVDDMSRAASTAHQSAHPGKS